MKASAELFVFEVMSQPRSKINHFNTSNFPQAEDRITAFAPKNRKSENIFKIIEKKTKRITAFALKNRKIENFKKSRKRGLLFQKTC